MPDEKKKSRLTTLCYIEKGDSYLMMHRVKKENDVNKDKWVGVGGHFEEGESPEECLLREVREETGFKLLSWQFRGIITFISDNWPIEYMCLYTADAYERIGNAGTACVQEAVRNVFEEKAEQGNELTDGNCRAEGVNGQANQSRGVESVSEQANQGCGAENMDNLENWECTEGNLEWVRKADVYDLPIWEGDKLFFRLLEETNRFFSLKLRYEGECLAEVVLDGKNVDEWM